MSRADEIALPNWYLGAGCIPTAVWDALSVYPGTAYLHDIDLVYHDAGDLDEEREKEEERQIVALFRDLPVTFDVKNQARVHLWYAKKYGWSIPPYASAEAAIDTWLSVTAVGVRKTGGRFLVYAPYGLNDLLTMTVRPNKLLFTEERYLAKTTRCGSSGRS